MPSALLTRAEVRFCGSTPIWGGSIRIGGWVGSAVGDGRGLRPGSAAVSTGVEVGGVPGGSGGGPGVTTPPGGLTGPGGGVTGGFTCAEAAERQSAHEREARERRDDASQATP